MATSPSTTYFTIMVRISQKAEKCSYAIMGFQIPDWQPPRTRSLVHKHIWRISWPPVSITSQSFPTAAPWASSGRLQLCPVAAPAAEARRTEPSTRVKTDRGGDNSKQKYRHYTKEEWVKLSKEQQDEIRKSESSVRRRRPLGARARSDWWLVFRVRMPKRHAQKGRKLLQRPLSRPNQPITSFQTRNVRRRELH